jgi:hypothetical protein
VIPAALSADPVTSLRLGAELAHGVGTRADLPLPTLYVIIGGGLAVVISFLALGVLWREPRLRGGEAGRPLPEGLAGFLDSPRTLAVLRGLTLALTLFFAVVALAGSPEIPANATPWAFFVTFWVGLVPLSLLLGPVWGVLNPLRTLYLGLRRLVGPARNEAGLERLGHWPAAASLLAFVIYELATPNRADPRRVGTFIVVYAVVHLAAAVQYGEGWFARGGGFEVYSRLIGRLAVIGRRSDGVLVWRSPLNGVEAQPRVRGLEAVAIVLVGSTAFDGLTRTLWWQDGPGSGGETAVLAPLLGLACSVAAIGALYLVGCWVSGRLGRYGGAALQYAPSIIPIAVGYAIAHYFSLFMFDGQTTWILASDPFATGLNLLGLTGYGVDYTVVSDRVISLVQVGAIVGGHVLGVILAHDRAISLAKQAPDRGHPVQSQIPLLVVMVAFTLTGLGLLLGG